MDPDIKRAIREMPKAELHFHFEGAFRWETIRELHPGRGVPEAPPWYGQTFDDFSVFAQAFRDFIQPCTGRGEWLERHAYEMLEDLARQNVRYVELIVSYEWHGVLGMPEEEIWSAVIAGVDRAEREFDIIAPLIAGISRNFIDEEAIAGMEEIHAAIKGRLRGIDIQGDERQRPNRDYVGLYKRAGELGLKRRAHAGEICGPESIREAVELCGTTDLSHGVRAAEDAELVRMLASKGTWLHTCPTSNVLLKVAPSYAAHQLRGLISAGVRCTVNSDDPLLFDTDVTGEYERLVADMGFSINEVAQLAKNAFHASLLDEVSIAQACEDVGRAAA